MYNTLSSTTFVPPTNPDPNPNIPRGSTGVEISSLRRNHDQLLEEFNQYDQADKALKSLLVAAVEDIYLHSLCHKYIGYVNVTALQMIQHLYDTYAMITESEREQVRLINTLF